jgi:hypothetical protein
MMGVKPHDLPGLNRSPDLIGVFHATTSTSKPSATSRPRAAIGPPKSAAAAGRSRGYLTVISHGDIAFPLPLRTVRSEAP